MNKKWWEGPTILFVDFWFIFLFLFVLTITAYFTRSYWLPSQITNIQTQTPTPKPTGSSPSGTPESGTNITPAPVVILPTETSSPELIPVAKVPTNNEQPKIGFKAPKLTTKNLSGEKVVTKDYIGQPVVLFIFASWCSFCKQEAPFLEKLNQKYKSQGLVILPIDDTSTDNETEVKNFVKKYNWTMDPLLDENGSSLSIYNVTGTPAHFFIDKNGVIQDLVIGFMDESALENSTQKILQ